MFWEDLIMKSKYCIRCYANVGMEIFQCFSCHGSSFVHATPDPKFCLCGEPEITNGTCLTCKKEIEPTRLLVLRSPIPAIETDIAFTKEAGKSENKERNKDEEDSAVNNVENVLQKKDIQDLIRAQNRTTHAVRAFVRFLFIQISATTAAVALWNIGDSFIDQKSCLAYGEKCNGSGFFYSITAMVFIGGIIWSSHAGWSELAKSEVK